MYKTMMGSRLGKGVLFLYTTVAALSFPLQAQAQTDTLRYDILLETDSGNIRVALYNETPKHRDNFLKLVRSKAYDGVLFHRVIDKFMIQTGDLGSKEAKPGELIGETPEKYSIPAEFRFPKLFHKRGALAAARESDEDNPTRSSSASQFYIVYGQEQNDRSLDAIQHRLNNCPDSIQLTADVREAYKKYGGTPHLDGTYTVFGEVLEGMDVVEKIQRSATDENDRPLTDIRIRKATVIKK